MICDVVICVMLCPGWAATDGCCTQPENEITTPTSRSVSETTPLLSQSRHSIWPENACGGRKAIDQLASRTGYIYPGPVEVEGHGGLASTATSHVSPCKQA